MLLGTVQCILLCFLLNVPRSISATTVAPLRQHKTVQSYYKTVDRQLSNRFPELNDEPFSMAQLEEAPKYILQLMQGRKSGVKTNTVHGVQAKFGMFELSFAFAFNFPSLDKREQLIRAELHLFVKRLVTRNRRRRTQISFHLIRPNEILQTLRSFNLAQFKTGWDIVDLTSFVQRTIIPLVRQQKDLRLAITFEARKANGKIQEVSLKRFVGPDGQGKPFILLFSNDTRHLSIDRITRESSHLHVRKERKRQRKEIQKKLFLNRHKRAVAGSGVKVGRKLVHLPWQRRHNRRHRRRRRKHRKKSRKSRGRGREHKFRTLRPMTEMKRNSSFNFARQKCDLVPMTLDFRDIGWHEWIISPQSFPINACAGTCQHLLWQAPDSISNHAFLQGVVHLISLPGSSVPPLGCVPLEFGSQTILYYDAKGNVAMREFPDMVVKRCGCR